jgi:hypothetical protein
MVVSLPVVDGVAERVVEGSAAGCPDPPPQATSVAITSATKAVLCIRIDIKDRTPAGLHRFRPFAMVDDPCRVVQRRGRSLFDGGGCTVRDRW